MILATASILYLDPSDPPLPAHEFALLWPALSESEMTLLVADISAHRVRNPILLYDEGDGLTILDGIHRAAAARTAKVPCPYTVFEGTRLEALAVSNSLNDRRRHLDTGERLAVAAREQLAAEAESEGDGRSGPSTSEIAASLGVSTRHYQRAKAEERERQGLPQPPGGQRPRLANVTTPTPSSPAPPRRPSGRGAPLTQIARMLVDVGDIPPPGEFATRPDDLAVTLTAELLVRVENLLYNHHTGAHQVADAMLETAGDLRERLRGLAATFPLQAKAAHQASQCAVCGQPMPSEVAGVLTMFCRACLPL